MGKSPPEIRLNYAHDEQWKIPLLMNELRVWAEDLEQENTLRFTWMWLEPSEHELPEEAEAIAATLTALDGVESVVIDGDGIVVEFNPALATRAGLAKAIREALGASRPEPPKAVDDTRVRVWAEDLSEENVRLTWQTPEWMGERDELGDRRRVAAWLTIQPEVKTAKIDGRCIVPGAVTARARGAGISV